MKSLIAKKIIAPAIPYITVSTGLLIFHNAWVAILSYHLCMVAVLLLSGTEISLTQVLRCRKYWIPVITALFGAGGGILLYLIWPLLSIPDDINQYIRSVGLIENTWPVFLVYFILINPFIEEHYWRGFLSSETRRITVNDALFSGYHLIVLAGYVKPVWLFAVFCGLTIGAWFWRQMNRLNGGLLASIVSHLAADVTVILTIYFITTNQVTYL